MATLSTLLVPANVLELAASDKDAVLRELSTIGAERAGLDPELVHKALQERERLHTTALGEGVAMPHVRLPGLKRFTVLLGRTGGGIEFAAPDPEPVRLFLLLIGGAEDKDRYAKLMARAARFLRAESKILIAADDLPGTVGRVVAEH